MSMRTSSLAPTERRPQSAPLSTRRAKKTCNIIISIGTIKAVYRRPQPRSTQKELCPSSQACVCQLLRAAVRPVDTSSRAAWHVAATALACDLESMGRGRAAGALIIVFISGALTDIARGGDLVACEPQRVTGDGSHWAYRIVDGRECWYPGRPGKSKNELFWDRGVAPSARRWDPPEAETGPSEPPSNFMAAPPEQPKTPEATPEQWHGTAADQLLAFTCCWPEFEEPA